ncbi:MAG TPA: phage holin family protein [Nocardioidaceae bacterium]|nr:phage holin family protein [Nocardioidaceae bacterium]
MAETTSGGSTAANFSTSTSSSDVSTSELISRLTQQSTDLIRSELRLAQAEMTEKAKHAGVGAGLFGGAGIVALYGGGALVATAVLALDLVLPAWLAALIVAVVLLAVAGVAALMGKKQITQATPAAPQHTIESVKQDVDTIKEAGRT